jgi:hypothetical protein
MQALIRKKLALGYTVHGFRSSFMDWVAEVHPQRLLEAERALATRSAIKCSGHI